MRVHLVEVEADADFDAMFRQQYPRLVALGAAMSGSIDVGRELAQEAMLRAHAKWDDVSGYDNPAAWLRRVMTNLLIDRHRRESSERAALSRLPVASSYDTVETPISWAELVAPLPVQQRVIVTLHYGDDMSVDRIAELLDIAPGSVKSALSRARQRLHDVLAEGTSHE